MKKGSSLWKDGFWWKKGRDEKRGLADDVWFFPLFPSSFSLRLGQGFFFVTAKKKNKPTGAFLYMISNHIFEGVVLGRLQLDLLMNCLKPPLLKNVP